MRYIIDSANRQEVDKALSLGIQGVTANPTMYAAQGESFYQFIEHYAHRELGFLSGELMGESVDDMLAEANRLLEIDEQIVMKINYSEAGLEVCSRLAEKGIKTALTLVFTIPQATAALQTGVDYLFAFIGRNDEYGNDGLRFVKDLQKIIKDNGYSTKVVAASIKNLHQLEEIAVAGIDFAAIPYDLYMKSLQHPLTESGKAKFEEDWRKSR